MAKFASIALLVVLLSGLCAASRVPMSSLGRLPGRRLLQFANITLPDLPYAADALEPVISEEIMVLHHDRHHQAYVNGFNTAVVRLQSAQDASNVSAIVDLTSLLNFNGGGHVNHALFWESLTPVESFVPVSGSLAESINDTWGSFEAFQAAFEGAAAGVQGSGWVWLGQDPATGALSIRTTANQDTLAAKYKLTPLLGVDLWEHSYYLQYKNVRADYVDAIWQVINWPEVESRFTATA
ncbi:hypothetical protein QBZ16_002477 [Prototheca wickerhamii]|uniref:Superoxide dismutase n=1 Tax=Prototheca wickerhamii TaxID=3111 RepID=A0AAD9IM11_PROWI|nr:hypothetical protein QBZ16_002477 [Prototheca wickerhamii]